MVFTGENGLGPVITALEKVLPGDITGLGDRKNRYSLLLNEEGGILDDLMVTKRITDGAEELYMVVNGATKYDDIAYLLDFIPDDATLNLLDEQALLAPRPKAVDALSRIVSGVENLVFMTAADFTGRRAAVDQPLGLYRRGRLRNLDPGRARCSVRRPAVRAG